MLLPPAVISALAAFQELTELQKARAALLTSASLCSSCRHACTLLFSFFFAFKIGLDKISGGILRPLLLLSLKGAWGAITANEFDEEKASLLVCLVQGWGKGSIWARGEASVCKSCGAPASRARYLLVSGQTGKKSSPGLPKAMAKPKL